MGDERLEYLQSLTSFILTPKHNISIAIQQFSIWLAAADKSAPTKGKVGLRRLSIADEGRLC
ncbi:MAG: hypothetical protein KF770_26145, partial [Anaerolineae bacterium]|nr:hypothetical protein [Anaerolineae bacterium]